MGRWARLGAASTPSPDVRDGHPARHSLGCRLRFAILAPLDGIRRLPGHWQPLAGARAIGCLKVFAQRLDEIVDVGELATAL
jgi:hypothetical protein